MTASALTLSAMRRARRILLLLLLPTAIAATAIADEPRPHYSEHQDLSYSLNASGEKVAIRTPEDWQLRRAHILARMQTVMGPLPKPATPVPLQMKVISEQALDGCVR